jgi:hypothetical protein
MSVHQGGFSTFISWKIGGKGSFISIEPKTCTIAIFVSLKNLGNECRKM